MYSIKKSIIKVGKSLLIIAIPILVVYLNSTGIGGMTIIEVIEKAFPVLATTTISGVFLWLLDWLKHKQ